MTKNHLIKLMVVYILIITCITTNYTNSSIQALVHNDYTDISVIEAYNLTENTSNLFILDVRTKDEYSSGHLNSSYLIPYTEISSRQEELPENKSQPFLVYCRSGRRSAIASGSLADLNYTTIFNMLGGFTEWKNANYPFESSNHTPAFDFITLIIVITIFSSLGLILIISVGLLVSKKK